MPEGMQMIEAKELWLVDVTKINNSWRLKAEIEESNCKIVERRLR